MDLSWQQGGPDPGKALAPRAIGGVKPCFAASADRKNESVSTFTLNQLCKILTCRLEDVAEYTEEDGM